MKLFERLSRLSSNIKRTDQLKSKVAADLSILIALAGLKRKDVAKSLEISEAALSIRLNGMSNLTLESIDSICKVTGADFDVVFRKPETTPALSFFELEEPETNIQLSEIRIHKINVDQWRTPIFTRDSGMRHFSISFGCASSEKAANDCTQYKYA
jgi:transcriptional regulator with XRE-family HTH domain